MRRQQILEIGRIYFGLAYEDDDLHYPIIHSYEYLGLSERRSGLHKFRCLGSNDSYFVAEDDLEFISTTETLAQAIKQWATKNPTLAS